MTGSPHPVPTLSADYGQTNTNTETDTNTETKTNKKTDTGKGDARGKGGLEREPAITACARSAPTQSPLAAKVEETEAEQLAHLSFSASLQNATSTRNFVAPMFGVNNDLTVCAKVMADKVARVQSGDLREIEETLVAQAVTLNAVFTEMLRRAVLNIGQHQPAMETYMRLGLKAQAQCRVTLETLAEIKNPRPVFARQANFVAGNQQVNNAEGPQQVNNSPARAENSSDDPTNKLLERP